MKRRFLLNTVNSNVYITHPDTGTTFRWKSRSQNACTGTLESRNLSPHPEKILPYSIDPLRNRCAPLHRHVLNTNKKAATKGHRPKPKSHFPAGDAAISTWTWTLSPQLWRNSHYGCGKEIVPRWEVNYLAWHKECGRGKFHLLFSRRDIFCSNISLTPDFAFCIHTV